MRTCWPRSMQLHQCAARPAKLSTLARPYSLAPQRLVPVEGAKRTRQLCWRRTNFETSRISANTVGHNNVAHREFANYGLFISNFRWCEDRAAMVWRGRARQTLNRIHNRIGCNSATDLFDFVDLQFNHK